MNTKHECECCGKLTDNYVNHQQGRKKVKIYGCNSCTEDGDRWLDLVEIYETNN